MTIDAHLSCEGCYASIDPLDITLAFDVSDYDLNSFSVIAGASVDAAISGSLKMTESTSVSGHKKVVTININPIVFFIGPVPVSISGNLPITIGYSLTFNMCADITAAASIGGSITHGLVYTKDDGFTTQHTNTIQFRESKQPDIDASAQATVVLWVQPTLNINVEYIGGPSITVRPQAEIGLNASLTECNGNPGLSAAGNWGLSLALAANVHINLPDLNINWKKTWGPKTVFGPTKWPLFAGCLEDNAGQWSWAANDGGNHDSGRRKLLAPSPTTGRPAVARARMPASADIWRSHYQRVWHGITSPASHTSATNSNCTLGARMSLQLLGKLENNTLAFAGVHSYNSESEQMACTAITLFHAIVDALTGLMHLTPATTDTIGFGLPMGFAQCTHNGVPLRPTLSWSGMIATDLSTLMLHDSEHCESVELSNRPAMTPNARSRRAPPPPLSRGGATAATGARKTAHSHVNTPNEGTLKEMLGAGRRLDTETPSMTHTCPGPTPPAPPSSYYGQYTTCAECIDYYGWCTGDITIGGGTYLGGCYGGSSSGPEGGTCSGWAWSLSECPDAPPPHPPPSPPYAYYGSYSTCWTCTQYSPQGWCPGTITLGQTTYEGGCFEGSDSGPMGGTCDNWVCWYQSDCNNVPPPSPPLATYSYYPTYTTCDACVNQYEQVADDAYGWCQGTIAIRADRRIRVAASAAMRTDPRTRDV